MIPGSFDYHRPKSVADAVALLVKLGEDARPLAGGHSLIPMMKTRLATCRASGRFAAPSETSRGSGKRAATSLSER